MFTRPHQFPWVLWCNRLLASAHNVWLGVKFAHHQVPAHNVAWGITGHLLPKTKLDPAKHAKRIAKPAAIPLLKDAHNARLITFSTQLSQKHVLL